VRSVVYVDGFNLYYGCLRGTPYRWLDLAVLCSRLLPSDTIVAIKYFTAHVSPRRGNPQSAQRQQIYLRALRTVPNLQIYLGHFLKSKVRMPLVTPPPATAEVWKTEEKGSDVNLATQLLVDGFRQRYERAVIITNDGDLKQPVEFVRDDLGLPVGVLNPHPRRSWALSPATLPSGSFYRPIRRGPLAASQFPPTLRDARGTFSKPPNW
jgi:NYN domain